MKASYSNRERLSSSAIFFNPIFESSFLCHLCFYRAAPSYSGITTLRNDDQHRTIRSAMLSKVSRVVAMFRRLDARDISAHHSDSGPQCAEADRRPPAS
jgi:hypothetical protein